MCHLKGPVAALAARFTTGRLEAPPSSSADLVLTDLTHDTILRTSRSRLPPVA